MPSSLHRFAYVYPLKFLFTLGINDLLFGRAVTAAIASRAEASALLAIYSFGFAGVYFAFALLYLHAWRLRARIELSDLEKFDTRYLIVRLFSVAIFALCLASLASIHWIPQWSGYAYFLILRCCVFSVFCTSGGAQRC